MTIFKYDLSLSLYLSNSRYLRRFDDITLLIAKLFKQFVFFLAKTHRY